MPSRSQTLPTLVSRVVLPALAGVLSGAAGLSIAHLIAQLIKSDASPIVAVGNAAIDFTPTPLKEYAIRQFGSHDKAVLVAGILVVLALLTMVIGIVARHRFGFGVAVVVVLGVVALAAELRQHNATAIYVVPTAIGLTAAVLLLRILLRSQPAVGTMPAGRTTSAVATMPSGGSRRQFLALSAGTAALSAVSITLGNAIKSAKSVAQARGKVVLPTPTAAAPALPAGTAVPVPGVTPFVTANRDWYRVDTALVVPQVDPNTWKLQISGMVDQPTLITYDELLSMPMVEHYLTQACVSNEVGGPYISTAKFLGVPLTQLMDRVGLNAKAEQLFSTSTDGFTTSTPTKVALDGRAAMIAVAMNGEPLPVAHGFPARMIVPGLYGYVSGCKWITSIKAGMYADDTAYWTERGWDINGPILTETRVDVPRSLAQVKAGVVPVAGISWAQHKGISRVQVQVDDSPWQDATLASVPNVDTWRQWWFKWNATPGRHTIRARAVDATGYVQTEQRQDVYPRGATGIPETVVVVS